MRKAYQAPLSTRPYSHEYEAGHALLLRSVGAGRDRAHRDASGRCTGTGGVGRVACLSPFHFHRVFRGMVGETPLELTRRLRLERAAWRLRARRARSRRLPSTRATRRTRRLRARFAPVTARRRPASGCEASRDRDRRVVWRSLQRRRCGTAVHRSRLRRTHHGNRHQGHARLRVATVRHIGPVQPDSESVRAPGRRGRPRRTAAEGRRNDAPSITTIPRPRLRTNFARTPRSS